MQSLIRYDGLLGRPVFGRADLGRRIALVFVINTRYLINYQHVVGRDRRG